MEIADDNSKRCSIAFGEKGRQSDRIEKLIREKAFDSILSDQNKVHS